MIDLADYNLVNLTQYLGDIKTVEAICFIWNLKHANNSVRVLRVAEPISTITLAGVCDDVDELLEVCKYLTTIGVDVQYEKSFMTVEV